MKKILLMTTAVVMSATSSFATDLSTIAAVKSAISSAYTAAGGSATGGDAHVAIIEEAINQVGTVKSETVDYASFGWGASTDVSIGTNVGVEFITEAEVAVDGISIHWCEQYR